MKFKKSLNERKMLLNFEINYEIFSIINAYAPNVSSKNTQSLYKIKILYRKKKRLELQHIFFGYFNCQINDTCNKNLQILKNIINNKLN